MFDARDATEIDERGALHVALDRVLDARSGDDGAALAEAIRSAVLVGNAIDGALVEVVSGFEASMEWARHGHRSPVTWLVTETGVARRRATAVRRVCLAAAKRPHVADAAHRGLLSATHLQLLVDARRAPVEDLFDRDEATLVADACRMTADGLRLHLERWRHAALVEAGRNEPDRPEPKGDGNRLHLHAGFGGRGIFSGELTPQARVAMSTAIDAEIDRLRAEGALEGDTRSYAELAGDVLVELVERGAARPDGAVPRPLVIAQVDIDTLVRRADASGDDRMPRVAELLGDGPVEDRVIAELATRADVALLVTGRGGQPLWFGRSRRLASAAQRNAALAAHHGHCYWPGCCAPAHRCDTDHLTGWEQGGATDMRNLAPLCRFHNRLKHRGGYRAARAPDGSIEVFDRSGQPVSVRYRHDP